jgi:AraC family transcriptional regulator of adaptative response/methylated-DNA-[protein]-cysteine methyltransferase
MLTERKRKEYYRALLDKNKVYEGIFFVGVRTTGVFCRPTCPARKPKIENCEFFEKSKKAIHVNGASRCLNQTLYLNLYKYW